MEDGGAIKQRSPYCAGRINKFEEQQPSRVDAEIEKDSSHSKGQVGAADKVAKLDIQIGYAGTGTLFLQLLSLLYWFIFTHLQIF